MNVKLKLLSERRNIGADAEGRIWRRGTGGVWLATDERLAYQPRASELEDAPAPEPEPERESELNSNSPTPVPGKTDRAELVRQVRLQGGPADGAFLRADRGEAFEDGAEVVHDGNVYSVNAGTATALWIREDEPEAA